MAKHLAPHRHVRVFTNSLRVAEVLADAESEVYVPGGLIRPQEQAIGGTTAVRQFGELWFDIAFIGVSGITNEGLYDFSVEDMDLKKVYLQRSSRRVVLANAAKFDKLSLVRIGALADMTDLVTEKPPPDSIQTALDELGIKVHIAAP